MLRTDREQAIATSVNVLPDEIGDVAASIRGRAMHGLANETAFDFDELALHWGDVVLAAIGWGEWQQLERSLAEGLEGVSDTEDRGERVDPAALRASVVAFRRARGLLAGEDYERWLSERSLSTADVIAHFTRGALSDGADDGPADRASVDQAARDRASVDQAASDRASGDQLAEAIRGEAILSGRLQAWAERLARCAAAARGLKAAGEEPPTAPGDAAAGLVEAAANCLATGLDEAAIRDRAPRVSALLAAERAFIDRVVTREAIERCLAEHRLDWQRFAWVQVTFADEGAAREAALWVREDGMALDEVAALAHVAADVHEAYSDDVEELSGPLAAASPGELLGPLADDSGWRLLALRERKPPTANDAVLRERARRELVQDALGRYLAGRVRWHGKH